MIQISLFDLVRYVSSNFYGSTAGDQGCTGPELDYWGQVCPLGSGEVHKTPDVVKRAVTLDKRWFGAAFQIVNYISNMVYVALVELIY